MAGSSILVAGRDVDHALGRFCARGFESLGHDVTYFDTRTGTIPVLHITYGTSEMNDGFVRSVSEHDPDIVLIIKGDSLPIETIKRAKAHTDAVFCNWNPDNPFMARSAERRLDTYLEALPAYDVAFIWTEELFKDLREAGAQTVASLPFGYDSKLHRPAEPNQKHHADVVFVGHWSEKRQRLLAAVAELDVDLAIYGNYWKRKCFDHSVRRCLRGGGVFGEAYAKTLAGGTVAINVVADHNLEAWNMKTFEIPAIGTAMITSETQSQRDLFAGEGAAYFETADDLKHIVSELLNDDQRRANIAESGNNIVEPHNYRKRMSHVIDTVKTVE
jgi:spore maturation protein CgeB